MSNKVKECTWNAEEKARIETVRGVITGIMKDVCTQCGEPREKHQIQWDSLGYPMVTHPESTKELFP